MATIKEKIAERGLKLVSDEEYEAFIIALMRGNAGSRAAFTKKVNIARKELRIPASWNLIKEDFNPQ